MMMNKHFWIVLLCLIGSSSILSAQKKDTVDLSGYFVFGKGPLYAWVYGIGDGTFIDFFQEKAVEIEGETYIPRIRRYSLGGMDTTYFRNGKDGVYHVNAGSLDKKESLTMPNKAWIGMKWFESDSSWSYTVISTTGELDELKDLLVVRSMQVKGSAAQVGRSYDTYYAKGIGMIASMAGGKIAIFLKEIKYPGSTATDTEK